MRSFQGLYRRRCGCDGGVRGGSEKTPARRRRSGRRAECTQCSRNYLTSKYINSNIYTIPAGETRCSSTPDAGPLLVGMVAYDDIADALLGTGMRPFANGAAGAGRRPGKDGKGERKVRME